MSTQGSLEERNGVLQEIDLFLRALFLKDIQSLFGGVINGSMSSCTLVSRPVDKVKIAGNFNNLRFSRCLVPVAVSSPASIPTPWVGVKRQGCGGRATLGAASKKLSQGISITCTFLSPACSPRRKSFRTDRFVHAPTTAPKCSPGLETGGSFTRLSPDSGDNPL